MPQVRANKGAPNDRTNLSIRTICASLHNSQTCAECGRGLSSCQHLRLGSHTYRRARNRDTVRVSISAKTRPPKPPTHSKHKTKPIDFQSTYLYIKTIKVISSFLIPPIPLIFPILPPAAPVRTTRQIPSSGGRSQNRGPQVWANKGAHHDGTNLSTRRISAIPHNSQTCAECGRGLSSCQHLRLGSHTYRRARNRNTVRVSISAPN